MSTPNELWEPTRWGLDPREDRLRQLLLGEGIDEPLAEGFARAMGDSERHRRFHRRELLEEFAAWANTHTHGGGGGDPSPPTTTFGDTGYLASAGHNDARSFAARGTPIETFTAAGLAFQRRSGTTGDGAPGIAKRAVILTDDRTSYVAKSEWVTDTIPTDPDHLEIPFTAVELMTGTPYWFGIETEYTYDDAVSGTYFMASTDPTLWSGKVDASEGTRDRISLNKYASSSSLLASGPGTEQDSTLGYSWPYFVVGVQS